MPRRVISARLAPLPPSRSFWSMLPVSKSWTSWAIGGASSGRGTTTCSNQRLYYRRGYAPDPGSTLRKVAFATRGDRSGEVQPEPVAVAGEAHPVVVRGHHPGRRQHRAEPAVAEQPRPAEDELAGTEVAVPRCHVVELDLGDALALVAQDDDAGGLVAVLHE